MDALAALEASALATGLRGSVWVYPLVNAAHIAGVALLLGAIVPLDLRLLGLWSGEPAAVLARVLVPVAATGLGLAVLGGALLFSARATEYASSPWFLVKMVVVAVGTVNAVMIRLGRAWRGLAEGQAAVAGAGRLRLAAAISLTSWLVALVLGRLVGYF